MIQEIHEEPKVLETFLAEGVKNVQEVASLIRSQRYRMVYLTGSGTSYHAGLAGQFAFSTLTEYVTSLIPASELPQWIPSGKQRSLLIAISQSGESSDVLAASKAALNRNIDVLAITNTANSSLVKTAQYTILTRCGRELAVTATKTYVAQLAALYLLSLESEKTRRTADYRQLEQELFSAPRLIAETIRLLRRQMCTLAEVHHHQNFFFLLGSGPNYATALEGALKLKEACNIFAEGFASREFLHGPIQLVDKKTTVFFILTGEQMETSLGEVKSVKGFGAPVISVCDKMDKKLEEVSDELVCVPSFPKVFSPMIYIIPMQLFAYYSSVARGLNPDKPEKLSKVVK
jgi:glucosamine--fructose-6-phosphate aminotransferase (isomerizing)